MESVAILGHTSHELAAIRLEQIRPALKQEFAALCSGEIPQCGEIFQEDLPKQLRDARETSKINEAFYSNDAFTSPYAYNKAKYKTYQINKNTNKVDKKQVFHRSKHTRSKRKDTANNKDRGTRTTRSHKSCSKQIPCKNVTQLQLVELRNSYQNGNK